MASRAGAWLTSAFVFLLGVAALNRLLTFPKSPDLIASSLNVLASLFSNTVKGKPA
jgi:hypothetical protein